MLKRIASLVMVVLFIGAFVVTAAIIPIQSPKATQCTPSETTIDEATPDEIVATEVIFTEAATREPETYNPTETQAMTEAVVIETDTTQAATTITLTESDTIQGSYASYDCELLARAICMEAGNCSEYCQWLVGSTVLNLADRYYGGDIETTVTNPNMFAVAYCLYYREPSALNWSVAERLLAGDRDYQVMAFRAGYYHSFGEPYTSVDNVYFSTF